MSVDTVAPRPKQPSSVVAVGGFFALALVVTLLNAPGDVIADARYEHLAEPGQFLQRHTSIWDDSRSLGAPTRYFSPVLGALQAVMASAGAAPWVIQRLTHTMLLGLAAAGAAQVSRSMLGRHSGWWAAGLLYGFGAYASQYLTPSGLFVSFALAPWFAWAAWRGVRGPDTLRWAALFALSVFSVGMLNTSSLAMAMVPVAAIIGIELWAGAATWRRSVVWSLQALALTVAVSLPAMIVLSANGDSLRFNLEATETPQAVAATASAAESWRGLGFWLTYFRAGSSDLRTNAVAFFTNIGVIAAGFVLLALAALAFVRRNDRRRTGLAFVAAASVVLMVGIHPVNDPSPFGSLLSDGFDSSLFLRGFRSMYKAGTGLQFALALLGGAGIASALRQLQRFSPRLRWAGSALLVVIVGAASFPFWTMNLYDETQRHDEVPEWWHDTFDFFESENAHDGVLVLPGLARTPYRWGYVNDTLFDAHLAQPVVQARTLPQSTGVIAAMTTAVDDHVSSDRFEPGTLAPVLRRMGVRWVVIQNDVDWRSVGAPRPSAFESIRADDDFDLVAAFGPPGNEVVGRTGIDAVALSDEVNLAPVEIYEVTDSVRQPRLAETAVRVAGGPDVVPDLAGLGWLAHPIVWVEDPSDWASTAGDSIAATVVTDGNQRRAVRVGAGRRRLSHLLGADENARFAAQVVFEDRSLQTTAEYGALADISATHHGSLFSLWDAASHPRLAVDGDPSTAWTSHRAAPQTLTLRFAEPSAVTQLLVIPTFETVNVRGSSVRMVATGPAGETERSTAGVSRPESESPQRGLTESLTFQLDGQAVTELAFTVTRGARAGGAVGIADVIVVTDDGIVDASRIVRVPGPSADHDIAHAASPTHHVFTRLGTRDGYEEVALARRFWSPGAEVRLRLRARTSDETPNRTLDTFTSWTPTRADDGPAAGTSTSQCEPMLTIDGVTVDLRPVEPVSVEYLATGATFESCEAIDLAEGWHDLATLGAFDGAIEQIELSPSDAPYGAPVATGGRSVEVLERSSTTARYRADVAAGSYVISDIPDHPGWTVTSSGAEGARVSIDGMVGWQAETSGEVELTLRFGPQRTYRIAWIIAGVALLICVVALALGPRRARRTDVDSRTAASERAQTVGLAAEAPTEIDASREGWIEPARLALTLVAAGLAGLFIADWVGMLVAVLVVLCARTAPQVLLGAAVVGPIIVGASTIIEGSLDADRVAAFVADRPLSHHLGLFLVIIWFGAATMLAAASHRPPPTDAVDT